jgi:hypothetical protein
MLEKLKTIDTTMLCDICLSVRDDKRQESIDVLAAVLNELELRVTSREFVLFCDTLFS